jgi:hypothetical protein
VEEKGRGGREGFFLSLNGIRFQAITDIIGLTHPGRKNFRKTKSLCGTVVRFHKGQVNHYGFESKLQKKAFSKTFYLMGNEMGVNFFSHTELY